MNTLLSQDRTPKPECRRYTFFRCGVYIILFMSLISSLLFAQESWPLSNDWVPMLTGDWTFYEDSPDVSQGHIDLITDASGSASYYASTTTSLFFRITLKESPVRKQGDLQRSSWSIMLDVNEDNFMDWFIIVGGISATLETFPNSLTYPDNDPDGTANWSVAEPYQTSGHVRVVAAPTPLYPDAVYMDVQVPYTALQKTGFINSISYNTSFKMIYGSSTSESTNLTDIIGGSTSIDQAFAASTIYTPSNPTVYGKIYDTRDPAPSSNAGIWYRNETLTVTGSGWPSSLSIYYNGGQRNVRILDQTSSIVWSGVLSTTTSGTFSNFSLWTIGPTVLPGIYTIQAEDPRSPGTYNTYDHFEIKAPVISVRKITSTPDVASGGNVNYSIRIKNTGNVAGTLSSVVDLLPTGFGYVTGSSSGLTTANPTINGDQITWTGSWSVGISDSLTLDFLATAALTRGSYLNNVTISGSNFAVISTGPTAEVTVTGPILTLNKSVDKASAGPGEIVTYTVNYSNTGDGNGTFIFILETIPEDTEYVTNSASGSNMTILYSHNNGISYDSDQTAPVTNLSYQLSGSLAPGASGSVSFQVTVK